MNLENKRSGNTKREWCLRLKRFHLGTLHPCIGIKQIAARLSVHVNLPRAAILYGFDERELNIFIGYNARIAASLARGLSKKYDSANSYWRLFVIVFFSYCNLLIVNRTHFYYIFIWICIMCLWIFRCWGIDCKYDAI